MLFRFRTAPARASALRAWALVPWLIGLLLGGVTPADAETLSHGRFRNLQVYQPDHVRHVALVLSGEAGWDRRMVELAAPLVADGALVVGIDVPQFLATLAKDGDDCVFPDGDLENLSHFVQAYYRLPTYFRPLLVGYSQGAALAYAVAAEAPAGLFAGAVTLAFCASTHMREPLCRGDVLRVSSSGKKGDHHLLVPTSKLRSPWVALQGTGDQHCPAQSSAEFVKQTPGARLVELPGVDHGYQDLQLWLPQYREAYASILDAGLQRLPPPPATLADLPIVEVPAAGTEGKEDLFAVLLSGDGGWAGLDKAVAAELAQRGIPVAGVDSLRYFWKPRTPAGLAADMDRVLRFYSFHWQKKRALLIGYSQGADVMPFVVNRLPPATRDMVRLTVLIGVSQSASFEFKIGNWLHADRDALPVRPEIDQLSASSTLCIYGEDDEKSICPTIDAHARVVHLEGGHHFDGDFRKVADAILDSAR